MCYIILDKANTKASEAVIMGMVLMFYHSALILFDLSSSYSYMLAYFTLNIDIMCKSLTEPIYVSILVGESLMVN